MCCSWLLDYMLQIGWCQYLKTYMILICGSDSCLTWEHDLPLTEQLLMVCRWNGSSITWIQTLCNTEFAHADEHDISNPFSWSTTHGFKFSIRSQSAGLCWWMCLCMGRLYRKSWMSASIIHQRLVFGWCFFSMRTRTSHVIVCFWLATCDQGTFQESRDPVMAEVSRLTSVQPHQWFRCYINR